MKAVTYSQRKEKWEKKSLDYEVNPARKASFILTAKNAINLIGSKAEGKMLDIGCGFGEIDIFFARQTDFSIVGCDISERVVVAAKKRIEEQGLTRRITIERGDVYNLDYPDNYFDVVCSFGYVSAATYAGVQKEVARVLKPGGILICDFINCWSAYKFFKTIGLMVSGKEMPYFAYSSRIREIFGKEGLKLEKQLLFNTYPPLDLPVPIGIYLGFEKTAGRILNRLLGRVRLIRFRKI